MTDSTPGADRPARAQPADWPSSSPAPREERESLRILMVTPHNPLEQGGVERHVMEVSCRLVAAGMTVEVLCGNPGGPRLTEQCQDGVVIRAVKARPGNRDYYFAPGLWREMGRGQWDVIHIQSYHTFVAPLAMLRALTLRTPYVVTFHGGGHSSWLRHRLRGPHRRALRPLLVRAVRLVAIARFEIDQYGRALRIPQAKFVLIPNGSDVIPSKNPPGQDPAGAGQAIEPLVASIGRLERYKGHHRVIAAFPYVLERRPKAKLLIVGSGRYESSLRRQVATLRLGEHVDFRNIRPGDRRAMADLLGRVSLLVLLSDFESGSITAIEAAAAGCRLLVAKRGGLQELAEDGLARSVEPDDPPAAIGRIIAEELALPREARTGQLTSWDDCSAALLDLYREVAQFAPSAQRPLSMAIHTVGLSAPLEPIVTDRS